MARKSFFGSLKSGAVKVVAKWFTKNYGQPSSLRSSRFSASLKGLHSDEIIGKVSRHQLIYSILGLVLGLTSIVGGIVLFLAGVTGAMS